MRILLIVVVSIVALLIVRMMLSAAPRAAAAFEPQSREPRSKHKKRRSSRKRKQALLDKVGGAIIDEVIESRDAAPWRRPKDIEWAPGQPVETCPNRKNQFHECTPYCFQRWGQRPPEIIASDK